MSTKIKRIDRTETTEEVERSALLVERFTLAKDGDGHEYVLPISRLVEFEAWDATDPESEDFDCGKFDEYRYDGGLLTFTDPATN